MRKYLVKRLLLSVVILFFVTFIIYLLMRCMPSSYVENMARQLSQAPGSKPYEEWLAQLNAQYGLDLGLIPGFFVQLKNLCTGNFGDSWKYTVPVIQKFNEVIWVSFIMGAISLVFELLIAVPLGIVVFISIGPWMRYVRTNMLEVLNADYIRTARAKGLSEHKVIYHHAFRNTLIPLVTFIGGSLPGLFAGALITETLFAIPGIGFISYNAMVAGDIPFSMFYMTFLVILTLLGNLISDILYAVVDPRVRIA